MTDTTINVLLVEDNPGDARLIRETLTEAGVDSFNVGTATRLSAGLEQLDRDAIDVVLLDLSLPDSSGMVTLETVLAHSPEVPIVVLTGLDDEGAAVRAVHQGAQDYLVKGKVDGDLLKRSICYALERSRLKAELERARQRETEERESHTLERLSGRGGPSVTAEMFGTKPIREIAPDRFKELAKHYMDLMECALEQRAYKVEHDISGTLRAMAEELGFIRAGPRDVVEVHTEALRTKARGAPPKKAQAYAEEGRLMVLELMGYLVSFYRSYATGIGGASGPRAGRTNPSRKQEERHD